MRSGSLLLGAVLLLAGAIEAQTPTSSHRPLEPEHWSYGLLEVLHALDRDQAWHPWQAPVLAATVSETLEAVKADPGTGDSALDRWRALFEEEVADPGSPGRLEVEAGFEASDALPWADRRAFGRVMGEVRVGERVTVWAEGTASREEGSSLRTGGVAFRTGGFQLLAGRLRPALGQGLSRILLNGDAELEGVWLGSARPVEVPGFGFLGRVSGHVFVGPGLEAPPADFVSGGMDAWFLSTAVRIEPHPRVQVGLLRTARFAGDSVEAATFGRMFRTLTVGGQVSEFDDSQGELAFRLRLDPFGVSLTPYASFGFEDRRALWEDPAVVVGVLAPFQVEGSLVGVRYEYTGFGRRAFWCRWCDYSFHRWYRHRAYGAYTKDGRPLGALLGGYGSAHQVELQYWSGGHPLRLRGVLFRERREGVPEKGDRGDNLLLDRWPGVRKGARLEIAARPGPAWEIAVDGTVTSTENGGENGASVAVRIFDVLRLVGG